MATFSVTPPLLGATPLIATALVASMAVLAYAMRGGPLLPIGLGGRIARAIAVILVLGGAYAFTLHDMARAWPALLGLVIGAKIAALLPDAEAADGAPGLKTVSAGLVGLSLLALWVPAGVAQANAGIGLVAGLAGTALLLGGTASAGYAVLALTAGLAAWGERLWPDANIGWPLALALGAWLAVSLAFARFGGWAVPVIFGLGALLIAGGIFASPTPLLLAIGAGAVGALVLPRLLTDRPALAGLGRLGFLAAGGLLLVLDNRLSGIMAIGVGGLALASGAVGTVGARTGLGLLAGLFAARVWIQLFLDRTALTGYGVDLTHPYAFAALIAGALAPAAGAAALKAARPNRGLASLVGLTLVCAPALVGLFIHIEALGGWLAGVMLGVFARAAQGDAEDGFSGVPLLLANVSVALLAAPWLVAVMNATREERLVGIGLLALLAGGTIVWWWVSQGRQPTADVATAADI